ncbi:uncharacterized protein [Diadema antillarum]|uniref:uncharacterized protein n=1 Tax=Diadema antillarum TaxID=105358 RepID=UPI003A85BA2B
MNLVLRGLNWNIALAFLDDVLVLGNSFKNHVNNLRLVLERFRDFKLKLKPKKCSFFQRRVEFLGREVHANSLYLKDEHIKAILDWPTPKCSKEVEQLLGLVNYHRVFLKNYAEVVGPLYGLTGKREFRWEADHQAAFNQVKELLTTAPVLALPNSVDPFILDTDASGTAIGAELIQVQEGQERVIAYGSCSLSPEQRRCKPVTGERQVWNTESTEELLANLECIDWEVLLDSANTVEDMGNEYILMMVDQFTKWIECVPLPSQTAEVTAQAAVNEFFCRFVYSFQIFTDQGRNFESKLFTNMCKLLRIYKARTTPYRPSANGQVERFNRTLMDAVRCYIDKSQCQWDQYLAQIAGAIRSTVNRSTGFTPNQLMLGWETNQPAELVYPLPPSVPVGSLDEYSSTLAENIRRAHDTARITLQSTQRRMKRDYDVKTHLRQFREGDRVYLLVSGTPKGKCKKLLSPWKGPAVIHKKKPDGGSLMIQCDGCDEWFHGACVCITEADSMNIDKYFCPFCKQKK